MKLFEFAPTRSIRVRWTLQELEIDFEAVTVNMLADEHRSPAFLKINPAGKLPVLVDGDLVLTESVASWRLPARSRGTRPATVGAAQRIHFGQWWRRALAIDRLQRGQV
jgi:glutathione S-transferase